MALVAACLTNLAAAGDGVLDLTQLANYANQPVPAYITKNNTTAGNAITDEGATLGRVLFHDKRLSRNDTVSCSSCHDPGARVQRSRGGEHRRRTAPPAATRCG